MSLPRSREATGDQLDEQGAEYEKELLEYRFALDEAFEMFTVGTLAGNGRGVEIHYVTEDNRTGRVILYTKSGVDLFIGKLEAGIKLRPLTKESWSYRQAYGALRSIRAQLPSIYHPKVTLTRALYHWSVNLDVPNLKMFRVSNLSSIMTFNEQIAKWRTSFPELAKEEEEVGTRIVNLTAQPIVILRPNQAPSIYPPNASARTLVVQVQPGHTLDGVAISVEKHPNQKDFPPQMDGTFYIVDEVSYRNMPFRRDLLMPGEKLTDSTGAAYGYVNLIGHSLR